MAKTVVIYHSGYGHTQRVAQFVAQGANATLIAIDADGNITDADWETLDAADAIIFGSPTYWAWPLGSSRNLPMHPRSAGSPRHGKTKWPVVSLFLPVPVAISCPRFSTSLRWPCSKP